MNIIRNKLLISSLQKSVEYKKSLTGLLLKFIKEEDIANTLKTAFEKKDSFETLLYLVETGDFFNNALEKTVTKIWDTLSKEQKQQIFRTMFNERNKEQTVRLLGDPDFPEASYAVNLFKNQMGELLYDKSFLCNLGKFGNYILKNFDYDVYNNIINNDELLDFYTKYTEAFYYINPDIYSKFSAEQMKKLIEKGELWLLDKTEFKNDINFVENVIFNNPDKIEEWIIESLPDNIKKDSRLLFSLLFNNSDFFDVIADEQTIKSNLFLLKYNRHKLDNLKYNLDKKLYILSNPDIAAFLKIDDDILKDLTLKEKQYFDLTRKKISIEDETINKNISKEELICDSKEDKNIIKFYRVLKINNDVLNLGPSNVEIEAIYEKIIPIIKNIAENRQLNRITANNLYYAIANSTLDLFFEFCNLGIIDKVNMGLISKGLIEKVGFDIIKNVSLFSDSFYYLLELDKKGKLDIYKKMLELIDGLPYDKIRSSNVLLYTCISYEKFIQKLIENNQLTTKNIMLLMNITRSFNFIDLNECSSLEEYYEKMYTFYDEKIIESQNPLISRELLCQRFFMMSYKQCMEFYDSAVSNIHNINDSKLKKIFGIFMDLKDCKEVNYIKQQYKSLQQENFKLTMVELFNMEEMLKKEIIGEYFVANTINNVDKNKIVDFTGKEFNCLIHVVGAYGLPVEADTLYESWNTTKEISNSGICTSLLSDNYLGCAPTNEQSVIFGFDNVSSEEIQIMGPYDLYSFTNGLETVSIENRESKYYNSKDLVNNTRALHNEVVINRNLSDGKKRQPSYILCFDNVNDESLKASKDFGVPIIFIDTKKHIEMKKEEMKSLKLEFVSTQSADIMQRIINMQETLKCGLLANNKDIADTIFNPTFITDNILFLINNCNSEELLNQLYVMIKREETRFYDEKDFRTVKFSGDFEYLYEQINIKKQKLFESQDFANHEQEQEEMTARIR